jgi:hypothetical protein
LDVPPPRPQATAGCFVPAVAVTALIGFGLLATLLSVLDGDLHPAADEPADGRAGAPPDPTFDARAGPPAGTILLSVEGFGAAARQLRAGGAWYLQWSFDCSHAPGGAGRFALDPDGPGPLPAVDEGGVRGRGTEAVQAPGAYRLQVRSLCAWTLTAVAA